MKKERILVHTNANLQSTFENEVEAALYEANRIIDLFINWQPWEKKLKTAEAFEALIIDPVKRMDDLLISHSGVDLSKTGGVLPDPEAIAQLLRIDRTDFINVLKGLKVSEGCVSCNKMPKVIKKGQGVINYTTFLKYKEYLQFDKEQGRFMINEDAVENMKLSFEVYAETEESIKAYHFWHHACDVLNQLHEKGCLGDLNSFSKSLGGRITFSYQVGRLSTDTDSLVNEVRQLNSLKN